MFQRLIRSVFGGEPATAGSFLVRLRRLMEFGFTLKPDVSLERLVAPEFRFMAIHLHPEDASLARLRAGDQLTHAGHRIHEDSKLKRGDVIIEAGGSHLDATLAARWRRVVEALGQQAPWIEDSSEP